MGRVFSWRGTGQILPADSGKFMVDDFKNIYYNLIRNKKDRYN